VGGLQFAAAACRQCILPIFERFKTLLNSLPLTLVNGIIAFKYLALAKTNYALSPRHLAKAKPVFHLFR
jgi:hypothetical protein